MATSSPICDVCDLRHITKPSIVWCTECNEGLCTECQEHHGLSKASRTHNVISMTEYQKLPTDEQKIAEYCSKHDEKFQMYCRKHECPCCSKCVVKSHRECKDIENLNDISQNAKTSNALCEIEESLVEVSKNLQKIRTHLQDSLLTVNKRKMKIENEIKKTRIQINHSLDKLQQDLITKLYAVEERENTRICQLMSSIEKNEKEIAEYQTNIDSMKQHASELQTFLSMKQIEDDISRKETFLYSLVEGDDLKQSFFSCKINDSIQNIVCDIKSFGDVQVEAGSCDIVLLKKKAKQAQAIVPTVQLRSIENIKLKKHKTINTQGEFVYGCCMLSDGRMAFTYFLEHTVKVFSKKGSLDFEERLTCKAFDIVYNKRNNTLAVSSGNSLLQYISIINVETHKLSMAGISLDSDNYGISLKDDQLVYSAHKKGIRMINMHDHMKGDIVQDNMSSTLQHLGIKYIIQTE